MNADNRPHILCPNASDELLLMLKQLKKKGVLRAIDMQFALFLYHINPQPLLALLGAATSYHTGQGHTCLHLTHPHLKLFDLPQKQHQALIRASKYDIHHWPQQIKHYAEISHGTSPTPLVYDQGRLYLHRYWSYETTIVQWLKARGGTTREDTLYTHLLHMLFPRQENDINWQKIAVAIAASSSFSLISGGPGTGKTTIVAQLIALFMLHADHNKNEINIALAAPTGKAAARLSESIRLAYQTLPIAPAIKTIMPKKAMTLHRLLEMTPETIVARYHEDNPLHLDVLIIDEASMVDLSMMARLLRALPKHARLILLGDKDQLSSVEAGSILGDLCAFAHIPYAPSWIHYLQKITGEPLNSKANHQEPQTSSGALKLHHHICLLKKNFRFQAHSGIGALAKAIKKNDINAFHWVGTQTSEEITLHRHLHHHETVQHFTQMAVQEYSHYVNSIKQDHPIALIHKKFEQFRVLCALRKGAHGVDGLNTIIEKALMHHNIINMESHHDWYSGRPIILTSNDRQLSLYNGDIGITLPDEEGQLRVAFIMSDGHIKKLLPRRVPPHMTAFAMTIHKSQGSEFDHTLLILPEKDGPLLTRELLYTGVTRARKKLSIFAEHTLLKKMLQKQTHRTSGLLDRLQHVT